MTDQGAAGVPRKPDGAGRVDGPEAIRSLAAHAATA
jgi:hypothetical protein